MQGSLAFGPLPHPIPCPGRCPRGGAEGVQRPRLLAGWTGRVGTLRALRPSSRAAGGSWRARGAQRGIGLPDPRPQRRPHSPRSGTWRTMFPATPSSSTWHGRRVAPRGVLRGPALASWWSRRRNRRHMTGGTGRDLGAPRGTSGNPRAWSRAAAGPGGAGARAGGDEGSSMASRRRRTRRPGRRHSGGIFVTGGGRASAQGLLGSGTCGLGAGPGSLERPGPGQGLGGRGRDPEVE